jgi:hypothetical protein
MMRIAMVIGSDTGRYLCLGLRERRGDDRVAELRAVGTTLWAT